MRPALCSSLLFLLIVSAAAAQGRAGADDRREIPRASAVVALTNARVVVKPGTILDNATILVSDGWIVGVGTAVSIPDDARVIDISGKTVYPGFIDGLTYAGVATPSDDTGRIERAGEPPYARAGISPMRRPLDFVAGEGELRGLRENGFLFTRLGFAEGMLPGGVTPILPKASGPALFKHADAGGQLARFDGAPGIYPATPMGILAQLRQILRRSVQVSELRAAGTEPSMSQVQSDRVIEEMVAVALGREPVIAVTEDHLEMRRMARLAHEEGFRLQVVGLQDAVDAIDLLQDRSWPLFLPLALPELSDEKKSDSAEAAVAEDVDSAALTSPAPVMLSETELALQINDEQDVSRERRLLIAQRREAWQRRVLSPALLRRHGVDFGFATLGVAGKEATKTLRTMRRHGIAADQLLAALTTYPARSLGLQNILGSVEPGRMANLLVVTGDWFSDTGRMASVMIHGEWIEVDQRISDSSGKRETEPIAALPSVEPQELASPGARALESRPKRGSLLIRGATVLTVTDGTLPQTDVLVEDGIIRKVGTNLRAPSGVTVISAEGKYLMPGIVDAHSHIAVSGPVNEWTHPVTAEVRIEDVIDPYDITIYRALAGGVTVSHIMHGSANPIGGQGETIKHRYGLTDPEQLKMHEAPRTIKFALGENPTRVHGRGFEVNPSTRMGVEQTIREAFADAEVYRARKTAFEAGELAAPPQYSLRLETIGEILDGEILVHCHSYRADEILMLLDVLKEYGVEKVTFQHVNEGFKVAPELARFGAMASVFSDWWAYKFEVYYSTAYNAAILERNGVVTSINSDSPELNRHLFHEAAKTMKYGDLSQEEALALITINPARQLGIDHLVGSIEMGKQGDLVLFENHPLSIYARPLLTVVDGVVRFDAERDPDDMRLRVSPEESLELPVVKHCLDEHLH